MSGEPPPRTRVTSPRTVGARSRARSRLSNAAEVDALTRLGEVYVQSLIRAQLRLAAYVVLLLVASLGLLPVAFRVLPVTHAHVLGAPLPWVVLGVLVYPWLLVLAWWYVRRAERNETAFEDLLDHRGDPEAGEVAP